MILSTSPGKYQVLWRVEGFDFDTQEITLKQLAMAFGGDPACTDCNRVLRIPGFLNRKYDPAHSSPSNIPAIDLDPRMTFTWMQRHRSLLFTTRSRASQPAKAEQLRERLGLGLRVSLPTAKMP